MVIHLRHGHYALDKQPCTHRPTKPSHLLVFLMDVKVDMRSLEAIKTRVSRKSVGSHFFKDKPVPDEKLWKNGFTDLVHAVTGRAPNVSQMNISTGRRRLDREGEGERDRKGERERETERGRGRERKKCYVKKVRRKYSLCSGHLSLEQKQSTHL